MLKTIDYKGKAMEIHVGNYNENPTCMSLRGTVRGLFGMKKRIFISHIMLVFRLEAKGKSFSFIRVIQIKNGSVCGANGSGKACFGLTG